MNAQKGRSLRFAALATMIAGAGLLIFSALPTQLKTAVGSSRHLAEEARSYLSERGFRPTAIVADEKSDVPSVPSMSHPLMGQPAPPIALLDHNGRERTLAQYLREGPVVIVFYYGYYCDHCVAQLFALDADLAQFRRFGAQVLAISADEPSHTAKQFATYGAFSCSVLSDPGNRVAGAYGVYKPTTAPGAVSLLHATFIVDKSGIVRWCQYGLTPFTKNEALLAELGKL
jgi:peroxiredoxin